VQTRYLSLGGRATLLGPLKICKRRFWKLSVSYFIEWSRKENLDGGSLLGTLRDMLRKALEVEHLSLLKGCVKGT